jgi:Tol biopolymer transport system component
VFLRDLVAGTTVRVSHGVGGAQPNGDSPAAAISGDGRTVVFTSLATNLVTDDTNGFADVFAYDRATGAVRRVNLTASGAQANGHTLTAPGGPATDFDGSVVAFGTNAPNLIGGPAEYDFVAQDVTANTVQRLSSHAELDNLYEEAESPGPSVSADGRRIAFAGIGSPLPRYLGDSAMDVVVRDRRTGRVTRVSQLSQCRPAEEISGYPAISANGRWVAFQSNAISLLLPGVYQGGVSPPMHVYVASALPVSGTEVCSIAVFPRNNDPGTNSKFRLVLSKAGRATVSIFRQRPGRRSVRRRTLSRTRLAAGLNTIHFSLRGLGAGRYVALARGSARGAPARRAAFTVRRR